MKQIYLITTNKLKVAIANNVLKKHGIEVSAKGIETPELQAFSSKEIAEYSVNFAYEKVKKPVIKTDVEYRITSLGGFPGPFVKYVNQWLSSEDLLNLMQGKEDRSMEIIEHLSFTNGKELKTFSTKVRCRIANKVFDNSKGSTFDKVTIREGFDEPQNLMTPKELETLLSTQMILWEEFGSYYSKE